uniref:Uncharacterized protein n=1 Tax=Cannabis sativa TaxID=3483 RepID=A0A803QJL9_CANSA
MLHVRRITRKPEEYVRDKGQLICEKLTVPKSKDLDKARGGKVMAIELLNVAIKSEDPRDRAFELRPLVFSSITQHQVELVRDEYSLPETIFKKLRTGCPSGSQNP